MMRAEEIKAQLVEACTAEIDQRIQRIQERLDTITDSRNNATKSSVGDKYETSRAMMQIEEEKSKRQLAEAQEVKLNLLRLDWNKKYEKALPGSLVQTNKGSYFISIGLGRVRLNKQLYLCVSNSSPVGKVLWGKQVGAQFSFNGQQFEVLDIN